MAARFSGLPGYTGVDTASAELPDRLASIYHDGRVYDGALDEAADMVATQHSAAGFMRGLVELAMEIRGAAAFSGFGY